jgi:hypothetical protein
VGERRDRERDMSGDRGASTRGSPPGLTLTSVPVLLRRAPSRLIAAGPFTRGRRP